MNRAIVHLHKKLQSSLSMKFNMEQCFRIALWMCLLIGCLQAKPTSQPCDNMDELRLDDLENVTCDVNVTFNSSTNESKNCRVATLKLFEDGLKKAATHKDCKDDRKDIGVTLGALSSVTELIQRESSGVCSNLETNQAQFKEFVGNFKSFVQKLNVMRTCSIPL